MTPNELRAAAERIVRTKEEGFGVYTDEHGNGPIMSMYDKDSEDLADAYLAEHPADDDETITEPWLQSVGFKILPRSTRVHEIEGGKHKGLNFCPKWIDPDKEPGAGDWGIGLFGEYGGYLIREPFNPKTRGAVRRLCAALGIPLTEPEVK